ncbi:MAG: 1,4-alpha-glucan branching protein domain-containing protein [Acidobacteriaceae bacterium]
MIETPQKHPSAYLTFVLHAHLPYVVNHGTWPHGLEWLHEAAAETYLPLLRVIARLERDGIALHCNLNISPILLEQLAHPVFKAEFPKYLDRKISAAKEDEAYFNQNGEPHLAGTSRYWQGYFQDALDHFRSLNSDIIAGFREAEERNLIAIITCGATHGYFPLLGTDESIRAQVQTGVATHERHIGKHPRGLWLPECAYRPAGMWNYPVTPHGSGRPWAPFDRKGVEEPLEDAKIDFFFVDTHLVEQSVMFTPYELRAGGAVGVAASLAVETMEPQRSLYKPYFVDGPRSHRRPVAIFPRDPRTGLQVWSGDAGYPGDGNYLDFHKKRFPGGHRYWQVTGSKIDMAYKTPYFPEKAAALTKTHAEHYVSLVVDSLKGSFNDPVPSILTSPFDAELFGHWWFEGPLWLEHVARTMAREDIPVALTSCAEYLDRYRPEGFLALPEGSWGKNGTHEVWLSPDTRWTWEYLYPAEVAVREAASSNRWKGNEQGERILKQLCRELLLLESSDWQFLITTEAARDYAEDRFHEHLESFQAIEAMWKQHCAGEGLREEDQSVLKTIETQDSVFAHVDPGVWARR